MLNYQTYTDVQLVQLLQQDDEAAFTQLFERYRNKLYYYILKHTKSSEIAEEIVTDIFMKLWEGRALAGRIAEPAAFLHKVGYYKALDFLKAASRQARLQQAYIDRMELPSEKLADEIMIDAETRTALLEAVNRLPPQRKLIYRLSREDGLTHEQIAAALNLSRSTVNNAMTAATRSVSQHLQQQLNGKAALSLFFMFM